MGEVHSPSATDWQHELRHLCLRGLSWGRGDRPVILALHGWLDNAASFSAIAPLLAQEFQVIALDFPGHGLSDHRPAGAEYSLLEYVVDIAELLEGFQQPVSLIGHSLGGIVASLVAAVKPERLTQLVLIDALGPLSAPETQFSERLSKAVNHRLRPSRQAAPVYASLEAAAATRMSGPMALSPDAAQTIVSRNLHFNGEGWTWRTDPRLRDPSLSYLTEAQVRAYLQSITTPTLALFAEAGLMARYPNLEARKACVADLVEVRVPGRHHCHLESSSSEHVVNAIRGFLA